SKYPRLAGFGIRGQLALVEVPPELRDGIGHMYHRRAERQPLDQIPGNERNDDVQILPQVAAPVEPGDRKGPASHLSSQPGKLHFQPGARVVAEEPRLLDLAPALQSLEPAPRIEKRPAEGVPVMRVLGAEKTDAHGRCR